MTQAELNGIGKRLRDYRNSHGMRAGEVASKLGYSRASLYRFERGGFSTVTAITAVTRFLLKVGA
jgi:predicted transcriptional regulator